MYPPDSNHRTLALEDWLISTLRLDVLSISPASSDASFRRYFRVQHAQGCHIVMDAPPDKENTEAFVRIANVFRQIGLPVPGIHHQEAEQGFLLLDDFGSHCLLDVLHADNVDTLYGHALDNLWQLQTGIDIESCRLPVYDAALLQRELGIFYEWFLEKLLGVMPHAALTQALDAFLIDSALEQPKVCVHRDYHSRNLMWLGGDKAPGILDFQDAVIGPITYDLVSLLRDCYVDWPVGRVLGWCQDYHQRWRDAQESDISFVTFKRWFDLMGLQRHLKAIGIFSRLYLRDDKAGYLAEIPRTLNYVLAVCRDYPELAEFDSFLHHQVLPIYRASL